MNYLESFVLKKKSSVFTINPKQFTNYAKALGEEVKDDDIDARSLSKNHPQTIQIFLQILKNWIRHFNGISTKYLESYLGWMRMLDRESDLTPQNVLAMSAGRIDSVYT